MTWRSSAACLGLAHEWHDPWYPEAGGDVGQSALYREARAVCGNCPVTGPCLDDAMAAESGLGLAGRWGFRAGTTPRQRWQADPNRPPSRHEEDTP